MVNRGVLMQTLCFVTQRGGCAKTTSAVNISYLLAKKGYKVLAIDLDPQGHLAKGFGLHLEPTEPNMFQVFVQEKTPDQIVRHAYGVDIWPSTKQMFDFERTFVTEYNREYLLQQVIKEWAGDYDFVIIDNQPALSLSVVNSIFASDWFAVPVFPETWSLDGLKEIQTTVQGILRYVPDLPVRMLGLFLANVDPRTNVAQFVQEVLHEAYSSGELFETMIPRSVAVSEAIIAAMPLCEYSPDSKPALAYASLADEMLERMKGDDKS